MIISYSFLKAFEQCPLQQKLIRIDKVIPKKIDERPFIAGSVGHRFFEIWANRRFDDQITPKTVERILNIMSKRKYIVWRNKSDYEKVKEKVINEADMIIETVHHHGIDKLNNIQVEKFLSKSLTGNQHSVAGKVDIVANNGTWLLEMKMSADPKWCDPDQLFFYGLLIGAIQRRYWFLVITMNRVRSYLKCYQYKMTADEVNIVKNLTYKTMDEFRFWKSKGGYYSHRIGFRKFEI